MGVRALPLEPGMGERAGGDDQGPAPLVPIWDTQPPAWKKGQGLRVGPPDLGRSILEGVRRVSVALGAEVLRFGAPAP